MNKRSLRLIAVGAATAVGTALVYFLDPVAGPERRRVARRWMTATVRGLLAPTAVPEPEPARAAAGPALEPAADPEPEPESVSPPPIKAVEPLTFPAAVAAAGGQEFTTRLVAAGAQDTDDEEDAGAPAPALAEATESPRSPMEMIRWERGEHQLGDEVDRKRGVLYLQGDPTPESRVVAYDRDGEPLPPLVRSRRRDRLPSRLIAGGAAAAAASAVVLAAWAVVLERSSEPSSAATPLTAAEKRVIAMLTEPTARRVPVQGTNGGIYLVIGSGGKAALVGVQRLGRAAPGKVYEAWVIDGGAPTPAGIFSGAEDVVTLTSRLPKGATVAVTLERAGGVRAPTTKPLFATGT